MATILGKPIGGGSGKITTLTSPVVKTKATLDGTNIKVEWLPMEDESIELLDNYTIVCKKGSMPENPKDGEVIQISRYGQLYYDNFKESYNSWELIYTNTGNDYTYIIEEDAWYKLVLSNPDEESHYQEYIIPFKKDDSISGIWVATQNTYVITCSCSVKGLDYSDWSGTTLNAAYFKIYKGVIE